jgi:glycolate oxidase FAD binding subunit
VGEVLRLAADRDLAVIPRGAGTKIDWGMPPARVDIVLDTGRLAGIRHRPVEDDLVEVGAGTPVRITQSTLERTGMRLPIDVRSADATIGGVVASGEVGPLRLAHGTSCDRLVQVSYVDASGTLVRADTRTAEVSGADPLRLFCGSQGAFGVLVSATLRLQPVPASRVWVWQPVEHLWELSDLITAILSATAPAAVEVDLPRTGTTYEGQSHTGMVVALLEGEHPQEVAARVAALTAATGRPARTANRPPEWWLHYPFRPEDLALAVEVPIAHLPNAVLVLEDSLGVRPAVRGSAGLGVLYAALPGGLAPHRVAQILDGVRTVLLAREGRCRVIAAPSPLRQAVETWGDPADLSRLRRIKEHLDPENRLAPGRLPGGI